MSEPTATRVARAIVRSRTDPWQALAACQDSPGLMDSTSPPEVFHALSICAGCPVIEECRAWVESEDEYTGVAGGAVWTHRRRPWYAGELLDDVG